ncbi:D5-like protein [Methylobacter tundripaludum]|uniref:D5-like protein n=2 Tax=Methylobacter tundripaludum TaxID=173365 RepID=A0A2S6HHK0_9GAMM|nr:D5-like protein [Methylobacter tundripaludum]
MPDIVDENDEILIDDKTGSQGSHGALAGPAGSHTGSRVIDGDPEPEKKTNKKSKSFKAGQEDDDKEPESKLAKHIADALVDSLRYDEIGGDWYSQSNGLWKATTEKKALKLIMRVLDAGMPQGYSIAKLNNVKSFLMIYLLLGKWASNRHLLPMKNGVLDTNTMQLSDYNH